MPEPEPISETFHATIGDAELDRRYVVVDSSFAARLETEHSETFEVSALRTPMGDEAITRDVPNVGSDDLESLDDEGLARPGVDVRPGVLLVGKVTPLTGSTLNPEEKLLRAIFGEHAGELRDTSLRAPPGCTGTVRSAQWEPAGDDALASAKVVVAWQRPLELGDVLIIGGERSTVAGIRPLDGVDLQWSGGRSSAPVAKLLIARDVMHARCIGPYSTLLSLPTVGRGTFRGQPVLRPQVELLAEHAPWALFEMLTSKADAVTQRVYAYEALVKLGNPRVVG